MSTTFCETNGTGHEFVQPHFPSGMEPPKEGIPVFCTKCGELRILEYPLTKAATA